MKKRFYSFNLLRIILSFGVLLYHTYWNFGCTYGIFNYLISQSTFYMTTFFVLSGFVIGYSYWDIKIGDYGELKAFILKRFWSLYPTYIIVFLTFLYLFRNSTSVKDDIIALPFQLTLTFGFEFYGHLINWGAWFFSLLFFCYLFAPYLIHLIKKMSIVETLFLSLLLVVLVGFSAFIDVMSYASLFIRLCEFAMGIVLAKIHKNSGKLQGNGLLNEYMKLIILSVIFFISMLGIFGLHRFSLTHGGNHTWLSGYNIVAGSVIILWFSFCEGKVTKLINDNYIVNVISKYSMEIWVGTFFSSYCMSTYFWDSFEGVRRILFSIGITLFFAAMLACYRKLIGPLLKKKSYFYIATSCAAILIILLKGFGLI